MLVFGVITAFVPWYPLFVFTWWVTGTMAIACYTAAFVWTMEIAAGKWKIYLGMSMNYSWPTCRLIIAGNTGDIYRSLDNYSAGLVYYVLYCVLCRPGVLAPQLALADARHLRPRLCRLRHPLLAARVPEVDRYLTFCNIY